jgi:hypothetical protein
VGGAGTGIQVKAWKGSWWIFVNHHGQRKAKRVGTGKEGQKTAVAAEKIQARLVLGDLSLLSDGHMPRWISSLRRSWPVCSRRRRGEA